MRIGTRIRNERKRQGISQKAFAEQIGMSVSYLNDIEHGKSNPSLIRLKDISKALNINISHFVDNDNDIQEEIKNYSTTDENIANLLDRLLVQNKFLEILNEFKTFDTWSEGEIEEVLTILRIKNKYK